MEALGEIRDDHGNRAVRFERQHSASPEAVWAALTEPATLRRWLADAVKFDDKTCGAVELRFGDNADQVGRDRSSPTARQASSSTSGTGRDRRPPRFASSSARMEAVRCCRSTTGACRARQPLPTRPAGMHTSTASPRSSTAMFRTGTSGSQRCSPNTARSRLGTERLRLGICQTTVGPNRVLAVRLHPGTRPGR